jgi:hypothetical protein
MHEDRRTKTRFPALATGAARETAAETVDWRAFVLHRTVMSRSSGTYVYEFSLSRTEAILAVAGILNSDGAAEPREE